MYTCVDLYYLFFNQESCFAMRTFTQDCLKQFFIIIFKNRITFKKMKFLSIFSNNFVLLIHFVCMCRLRRTVPEVCPFQPSTVVRRRQYRCVSGPLMLQISTDLLQYVSMHVDIYCNRSVEICDIRDHLGQPLPDIQYNYITTC